MAKVTVWGSLRSQTGGQATVEIEARNVMELLARLGESYPGLQPTLKRGVSVSIDGLIYREGWLQPLQPETEVYLLPRMTGG